MARPRVYSDEFRERAVRLVREWRDARGVNDGGYTAISEQLGMQRETLRRWVIEDEVERGTRPGLTRDERARLQEFERETASSAGPTRSSRAWWLGLDEVARDAGAGRRILDRKLDHQHNYDSYREFMRRTSRGTARSLRKTGVAVLVIGDVAEPGRASVPLAEKVWDDVGAGSGLRLVEVIEDFLPVQNKVSRIWGDTKGKATDRDRVLVLAGADGEPATDRSAIEWGEPYRDAGPDAAHARVWT